MNDGAIVQLSRARSALAECKTVMEAKQIADVAEAARVYLERTNASLETVNQAAEVRALAERQMGAFLKTMPKANGGQPYQSTPSRAEGVGATTATLAQIGISYKESSRAQKLAAIPGPEFQERMEAVKAAGQRITPGKLLAPEQAAKEAERIRAGNAASDERVRKMTEEGLRWEKANEEREQRRKDWEREYEVALKIECALRTAWVALEAGKATGRWKDFSDDHRKIKHQVKRLTEYFEHEITE